MECKLFDKLRVWLIETGEFYDTELDTEYTTNSQLNKSRNSEFVVKYQWSPPVAMSIVITRQLLTFMG